jgi:hypothetical protein
MAIKFYSLKYVGLQCLEQKQNTDFKEACSTPQVCCNKKWFVRLLALRPLLAYCASLG